MIEKLVVSYEENPNLDFEIIETINGEKEYRRNCRYLKGSYYIKNKDIFYIDDGNKSQWYRLSSGKIEKDWETGVWQVKGTKSLLQGIVGFNPDGTFIFGGYTKNVFNNCVARVKGNQYDVINSDLLLKKDYFENIQNNMFYKRSEVNNSEYTKMTTPTVIKSYSDKGYNIEDNSGEFNLKKKLWAEYNPIIEKDVKKYAKYLGEITYG